MLIDRCMNGNLAEIKVALNLGADIDKSTRDEYMPCFIATIQGHYKAVSLLVAAGADINKSTYDGSTPCYAASNSVCIH